LLRRACCGAPVSIRRGAAESKNADQRAFSEFARKIPQKAFYNKITRTIMETTMKRLMLLLFVFTLFALIVLTAAQEESACDPAADYPADAAAAMEAADYPAAIAAYTCLIEANEEDHDAVLGRIRAAMLSGDYITAFLDANRRVPAEVLDAAIADYTAQADANPDAAEPLLMRGFLNWVYLDFDDALLDFEALIARQPDNAAGYLFRGSSNLFNFNSDAMGDDFTRAVELDPENATVYGIIGLAYAYALEDEKAIEAYTQAIELDPEHPYYYFQRANRFLSADAYEQAIADLNVVEESGSEDFPPYSALAEAYTALGELETAAQYYLRHVEFIQEERIEGDALAAGEPRTLSLAAGTVYALPFEAAAGTSYAITAHHEGFEVWPMLLVLDPDGVPVIAMGESEMPYSVGIADFTPEADGAYTIIVTPAWLFADSADVVVTVTMN